MSRTNVPFVTRAYPLFPPFGFSRNDGVGSSSLPVGFDRVVKAPLSGAFGFKIDIEGSEYGG
jgi:hypothetical protein